MTTKLYFFYVSRRCTQTRIFQNLLIRMWWKLTELVFPSHFKKWELECRSRTKEFRKTINIHWAALYLNLKKLKFQTTIIIYWKLCASSWQNPMTEVYESLIKVKLFSIIRVAMETAKSANISHKYKSSSLSFPFAKALIFLT